MAAQRKEYELLFQLRAALGGNFNSSFHSAIAVTGQLQGTLTKINSLQGKINGYQKQARAIDTNKHKLAALNTEHSRLQQALSSTEKPTKALQTQFEKSTREIGKTTAAIAQQEVRLTELGKKLRDSGVDTGKLSEENERLMLSYDRVKKEQQEFAGIVAAQQKNNEAITQTKAQLLGSVGAVTALGTAIYAGPVRSAMQYESAMSDVVKVVDGLRDSKTGQLTQEYAAMKRELLNLSTQIPMTAEGLTKIAAAAGQAGVARQEIAQFTRDAAKMSVAFDTTAETSGDWMAKWRASFRMNQGEVVDLADKINYLGNTSAAQAPLIAGVVTKIGPLGEVAGLASGEIAAMGATLLSVGVNEDVAATGIKKVVTSMTAGSAATARQIEVLDALGLSAEQMAKSMQSDAQGAIMGFMEALRMLPKEEQAAALKNYFGEESIAAIAPLLTNLSMLKEQFQKVGDSSAYAGSMEAEYAAKADTSANKVELAKNSLTKLGVVLGDTLLPYVPQIAESLSALTERVASWVGENPEAIKQVAQLTAGFLGMKAGTQAVKLGFLEVKGGVKGIQKLVKLFTSDLVKSGAKGSGSLAGATKAVALLKGAFAALSGPIGIATLAIAAAAGGVLLYRQAQEKARQETLHFSQDLTEAAKSFETVSESAQTTKALTEEYRALEQKVQNVATSTEEAAGAKARLKEIEQQLIDQNPDVLTKYDAENGKISENLELINRKWERETELAKIQYEQQQYEAERKLPSALGEAKGLSAQMASLQEQYDTAKKLRAGLLEIQQDFAINTAGKQPGDEAFSTSAATAAQKATALFASVGNTDQSFNGMSDVIAALSEYELNTSNYSEQLTKTNEELSTVTQSIRDYYDVGVQLAELDLGGNFQTMLDKLPALKNELASLEQEGAGETSMADALRGQIADLEPKLETAAATIRDLNTAVGDVPEVKTINVEGAIKDIDGFLERLNQIPPTTSTILTVKQSTGNLPGFANGGIITRPTVATFAEKSPEAAIPLDRSARSKALWAQTGRLLGVRQHAAAGVAALPSVHAPEVRGGGGQRTTTIKLESKPVIHITGGNAEGLEEQLSRHDDQVVMKVVQALHRQAEDDRRTQYD